MVYFRRRQYAWLYCVDCGTIGGWTIVGKGREGAGSDQVKETSFDISGGLGNNRKEPGVHYYT